MKKILIIFITLLLGGCMTAEERAQIKLNVLGSLRAPFLSDLHVVE